MEVIAFPDAVAVTIQYLFDQFDARADRDIQIGSRISGNAPRFVVVSLIDSEVHSIVVQRSTLRIECWVDEGPRSQENAQDLAQLVRALLGAMEGTVQSGTTVYRVADGIVPQGLNDSPDALSGKARYLFHVSISMRGAAA